MKTLILLAAALGAAWGAETAAKYYYDLGPNEVDVSSYPKPIQKDYESFKRECGSCHGLSRSLWAPYRTRRQWKRFVRTMHVRSKDRYAAGFFEADAAGILDFLEYDSHERKVLRRDDFRGRTQELQRAFQRSKVLK